MTHSTQRPFFLDGPGQGEALVTSGGTVESLVVHLPLRTLQAEAAVGHLTAAVEVVAVAPSGVDMRKSGELAEAAHPDSRATGVLSPMGTTPRCSRPTPVPRRFPRTGGSRGPVQPFGLAGRHAISSPLRCARAPPWPLTPLWGVETVSGLRRNLRMGHDLTWSHDP